ncbi:hypothetical protein ACT1UG_25805 [Bacillus paramycoides]|uniref:hypothetical protein n=1 Tax=Bacillus paramycoides TaxID=2026194 RepID=UPI001FD13A02|nr:hypothetical protein [Bacillus paramycoides]
MVSWPLLSSLVLLLWVSTVNPVPKDLPITMVIQDTGADLPGQGIINLGDKIKEQS